MSLATQAAEYASAMASAYAMDWHSWSLEFAEAEVWSDEAMYLAFNVRGAVEVWNLNQLGINYSALAWAETAARLMNGDY